jgi:hypothetical protein
VVHHFGFDLDRHNFATVEHVWFESLGQVFLASPLSPLWAWKVRQPSASLHFVPDVGHGSVTVGHVWFEILVQAFPAS